MNQKIKGNSNNGSSLIILSSIIYGATPILTIKSYGGGSNPLMSMFLRSIIVLPILGFILKGLHVSLQISKDEHLKIFLYCALGTCSTGILLGYAYQYLPVGLTTAIHFTYPVLVTLASVILLKMRINTKQIFALFLCIIGVFSISGVTHGEINEIGLILALLSACTYAFAMIFLKHSGLAELETFKFSFYQSLYTSFIMLILTLVTGNFTLSLTAFAWGQSLLVSILVSIIATYFLQRGMRVISSFRVSLLSTAEPIVSLIMGILFLGDVVAMSGIIGCVLILMGSLMQGKGNNSEENSEYDYQKSKTYNSTALLNNQDEKV